ncbi:MAG: hypothetical protein NVSMB7_08860 [Chitinophagaceae bacterium]
MDLSCIILSGDLELYVLGVLPPEDAYKIEQLALLFPEVQAEIDSISQTLEGFTTQLSVDPSPSVKQNLINKLSELKKQEESRPETSSLHKVTEDSEVPSPAPVRSITSSINRTPLLLAAASIGLVLSVGYIIYQAQSNNSRQQQILSLHQQVDSLHTTLGLQQRQITTYAHTINMLQDEKMKRIDLVNLPGKPPSQVNLYWHQQTHEVYLAGISLPAAPPQKQYQLWAIVNGKPVDAGLVNEASQSLQKMKAFSKADAFAITLEKKGGSPTPTMDAMYVMGKVS